MSYLQEGKTSDYLLSIYKILDNVSVFLWAANIESIGKPDYSALSRVPVNQCLTDFVFKN